MKPDAIPFLLCGVFCIIPILIGISAFMTAHILARRVPHLDIFPIKSEDGRVGKRLEWSLIQKEHKRKVQEQEEE
jgi:hypothetical protein